MKTLELSGFETLSKMEMQSIDGGGNFWEGLVKIIAGVLIIVLAAASTIAAPASAALTSGGASLIQSGFGELNDL